MRSTWLGGLALIFLHALSSPISAICAGDCDANLEVTVDEIVTVVTSSLDGTVPGCAAADSDNDGSITVADIVAAIRSALEGCDGAPPRPTRTPTRSTRAELGFVSLYGSSLGFSCADDEMQPDVDVCIANSGDAPSGPFSVSLDLLAAHTESFPAWDVPDLAVGGEICLSAPVFTSFTVRIDSRNQVGEKNEFDNTRTRYLPTLTRGPGCTPTPTPTGQANCCELASECSGTISRVECFNQGGRGFEAPSHCAADGGRCESDALPSATPTVTAPPIAPDLVPVSVRAPPYGIAGHLCPSPGCLLACVRNAGQAESPPFEVSIGSYWRRQVHSLPALHQICVLAAYPGGGVGTLEVDRPGAVGESDETNNALPFVLPARSDDD